MPVRLLIVDDLEALRFGVRALLAGRDYWHVCGEAVNGVEALTKVYDLRPDIVILDVNLPKMDGLRAAAEIRRIAPSTRIVLFTVYDLQVTGLVDAVVSKFAPAQELIAVLQRLTSLFGEIAPKEAAVG